MSIDKNKKLFGLALLTLALSGCGGGGGGDTQNRDGDNNNGSGIEQPDQKPDPKPDPETDFSSVVWPFDEGQGDMVAAAKVAGYYAVANASSMAIELRDISQNVLRTVSAGDISDLVKDMALSHDAPLCGMTFTPSGRFLYIAVCNQGNGDDAILALNLNTSELSIFDRVSLRSGSGAPSKHYGMSYFKSKLYVGSEQGVYRYEAGRNSVYLGGPQSDIDLIETPMPVKDIALDMVGENLYVLTEEGVYRLSHDSQSLNKVYAGSNLSRSGFSRVFGRDSLAGLYLTRNTGSGSEVLFVPEDKVRSANTFSPELINVNDNKLLDFTTTPDGKLFYSDGQAYTLTDKLDGKLSYQAWLRDELSQYVAAIKSTISSADFSTTNTFSPDGFLHRKIFRSGNKPSTVSMADNVGWAIFLLLAADKVSPDPEIEPLVELLIERHAGLKADGLGGLKTFEGHFVRNYETDGSPDALNPQPQVYTSMKFLPAVIKATEQYPANERISEAKQYLQQVFARSSDTIRARQGITWLNDDFGPLRKNNAMSNETWLYGDLGAAQDPLASYNYGTYVYERDNFKTDDWLKGEPVIKASHSAFIVMGGTLILKHHFDAPKWQQQNNNYYAVTQAETDDLGSPYFAAFSAGNNPTKPGHYYNDGPSDHPGNILHFPALLGFGQHGKQGAMVGGYFAYRDGLRQAMTNGSGGDDMQMLTRWSMDDPNYLMNSVGIADFWFGAIGLAETIRPGTTAKLRNTFYRPKVTWEDDSNANQVVYFSALTPRHVIGIRSNGDEQSFGFQRSPFTVPGGEKFNSFKAIDPEGDWIELDDIVSGKEGRASIFSNPDFEDDLDGWHYDGAEKAEITTGVTGQGAKVYSSSAGLSILTQAVEQSVALENSLYRVSAFVRPEQVTDASGFIRTYWSETGDRNSVLGSVVDSAATGAGDAGKLVSVDTKKPAGANYLHIEYVVDGADGQSFMFDNTSLQLFGAMEEIDNGDFEDGSRNWTFSHSQVSVIDYNSVQPEGTKALEFKLSGGMTAWRKAETDIDITADPDGTRYIFKVKLGEHAIAGDTEFDIDIDITDGNGKIVNRPYLATVEADSPDEIAFVMRKRPGETNFRVIFKMRQNENNATDRVVLDDFRVYKQRIFDADQCTGTVTGC